MGFFSRLYSRLRGRPAVMPSAPAEDWAPGDIAECIGNDWLEGPERRPGRGMQAMVLRATPGIGFGGKPGWGLELLGYAGRWDARAFRKLPPAWQTRADQTRLPAVMPANAIRGSASRQRAHRQR